MALLKLVGTLSPHRGHPLSAWLWCSRGAHISGPHGPEAKTFLGRIPPAGHCTALKPNTLQAPCEKGLVTCPGASARGAGYRHTTHLEALGLLLKKQVGRSVNKWIEKGVCMCAHSCAQRNSTQPEKESESLPFVRIQTDLEGVMLSEIRQRKTNTVRFHLYVRCKNKEQTHTQRTDWGLPEGRARWVKGWRGYRVSESRDVHHSECSQQHCTAYRKVSKNES